MVVPGSDGQRDGHGDGDDVGRYFREIAKLLQTCRAMAVEMHDETMVRGIDVLLAIVTDRFPDAH